MPGEIHLGDNLTVLRSLPDESVDLIYIDPPFNTGRLQSLGRIRTVRSQEGDAFGCHDAVRTAAVGGNLDVPRQERELRFELVERH